MQRKCINTVCYFLINEDRLDIQIQNSVIKEFEIIHVIKNVFAIIVTSNINFNSTGFSSFTLESSDFHHVALFRTYPEAKNYCRQMYTDLATVHGLNDMNNMITLVSNNTARAWIGLEMGDEWQWHWAWPDQKLDFINWRAGEPLRQKQYACAAMDPQGEWFESDCESKRSFVCLGK